MPPGDEKRVKLTALKLVKLKAAAQDAEQEVPRANPPRRY